MPGYDQRNYDEEEEDRLERDFVASRPYPAMVLIAGIVWIVFGSLIFVSAAVVVVVMSGLAAGAGGAVPGEVRGGILAGGACVFLIAGLFGAAFIYVGVQSVRGTATDTLGNSIGSLVFGVLNLGGGAMQAGQGQVLQSVINFLCGAGLIAAGILALVGRDEYRAWRKATRSRR